MALKELITEMIRWDEAYSHKLRIAEKPGVGRRAAMFFAHSGDSWFWGAGLLAIWYFGTTDWKRWAFYELLFISLLVIVIMSLKFTIRRKRPAGEWGAIYRNTDPHSFPSGHAARAFMIAFLCLILGPAWLAAILLLWAPLVTLSRVLMGVHYISDVIVGALIGIAFAYIGWGFAPLFPLPDMILKGF